MVRKELSKIVQKDHQDETITGEFTGDKYTLNNPGSKEDLELGYIHAQGDGVYFIPNKDLVGAVEFKYGNSKPVSSKGVKWEDLRLGMIVYSDKEGQRPIGSAKFKGVSVSGKINLSDAYLKKLIDSGQKIDSAQF